MLGLFAWVSGVRVLLEMGTQYRLCNDTLVEMIGWRIDTLYAIGIYHCI